MPDVPFDRLTPNEKRLAEHDAAERDVMNAMEKVIAQGQAASSAANEQAEAAKPPQVHESRRTHPGDPGKAYTWDEFHSFFTVPEAREWSAISGRLRELEIMTERGNYTKYRTYLVSYLKQKANDKT